MCIRDSYEIEPRHESRKRRRALRVRRLRGAGDEMLRRYKARKGVRRRGKVLRRVERAEVRAARRKFRRQRPVPEPVELRGAVKREAHPRNGGAVKPRRQRQTARRLRVRARERQRPEREEQRRQQHREKRNPIFPAACHDPVCLLFAFFF